MNKIITIYELLGLIKDDKVPKKIKYKNMMWKYLIEDSDYTKPDEDYWLFQDYIPNNLTLADCLDDNIEIIEEDKDIELLDVALLSQSDNWLWCPSKDDFEKGIELNEYIISNIRENTLNFQRKLNEVIKEVNKLRKENNNG